MAQHILLKHSTRRPYRDTPELPEELCTTRRLDFGYSPTSLLSAPHSFAAKVDVQ